MAEQELTGRPAGGIVPGRKGKTMSAELKQKTEKVMDIGIEGTRFICIFNHTQKTNPYHLYMQVWDNGRKLRQVERYGNLISVVDHIRYWMVKNNKGFIDTF